MAPGENLAGAGAELADDHDQRAVPIDVRIGIGVGGHPAVGVLDLDHRPVVDEEAGEVDGLGQRAAAVGAEVHDHGLDALLLEVLQDAVHVAGGALEIGPALAGGGHVHVEAGQIDHADLVGLAVGVPARVEDLAPGLAVFQFDGRPGDPDLVRLGILERRELQADDRAGLAANHLDHVSELHVHDVDQFAAFALAHADDLVVELEAAFLFGGPAGDDLLDHGVAVHALQRGPDAFQLQTHHDLEVFDRRGRHVGGVRIEGRGEAGEVHLQQLLGVGLPHALGKAVIALLQSLLGRLAFALVGLAVGLLRRQQQQIVLDPSPPAIVRLLRGLGVGHRVLVGHEILILGEILRSGQDPVDHLHPFVDPIQERVVNQVGEVDVALLRQIGKTVLVLGEVIIVALVEIHLHGIELLQEGLHAVLGDLGIQGMPEKMLVLEQRGDGQGNMAVIGAWLGKLRSLQRRTSRDEHEKSGNAGNIPAANRSGQQSHSWNLEFGLRA